MYYNIFKNQIPSLMKTKNIMKQNISQEQKEIESVIESIANNISEIQDLTAANAYLKQFVKEDKLFTQLDNNVYKYKDYFINIGKKFTLARHAIGLKIVKPLKLTSAPDLIAYSELKNNADCILITKIADTENCQILPYSELTSKIPMEAKKNFLNDIDKMYEIGQLNFDFSNKNNWYVVPSTNKIIISNWSDLVMCNNEIAKSNFKKKVGGLLGLIY